MALPLTDRQAHVVLDQYRCCASRRTPLAPRTQQQAAFRLPCQPNVACRLPGEAYRYCRNLVCVREDYSQRRAGVLPAGAGSISMTCVCAVCSGACSGRTHGATLRSGVWSWGGAVAAAMQHWCAAPGVQPRQRVRRLEQAAATSHGQRAAGESLPLINLGDVASVKGSRNERVQLATPHSYAIMVSHA